jgi:hypothetical protein
LHRDEGFGIGFSMTRTIPEVFLLVDKLFLAEWPLIENTEPAPSDQHFYVRLYQMAEGDSNFSAIWHNRESALALHKAGEWQAHRDVKLLSQRHPQRSWSKGRCPVVIAIKGYCHKG